MMTACLSKLGHQTCPQTLPNVKITPVENHCCIVFHFVKLPQFIDLSFCWAFSWFPVWGYHEQGCYELKDAFTLHFFVGVIA